MQNAVLLFCVNVAGPSIDRDLEQFITLHFDSEESLMIALTLRVSQGAMSLAGIVSRMARDFGFESEGSEALLTQKRIELRIRDLIRNELVAAGAEAGTFSYAPANAAVDAHMARVAALFDTQRADLNRIIYGTPSRARRLAEAFRL